MKSQERFNLSKKLTRLFTDKPVKGTQVREAHESLDKATADLTHAELTHRRATVAADTCSARVRDATSAAAAECKKGRAMLVLADSPVDVDSEPGHTPHVVHDRADALVRAASAVGVKLPALVARRDALEAAVADRDAAKDAKDAAGLAHREAREAWDHAYTALRTAVEAQLRHEGLVSDALKQRLDEYFPAQRSRRPAAEPGPQPPEQEKPAA